MADAGVKEAERQPPPAKSALESSAADRIRVSRVADGESWLDEPLRIRSDSKDKASAAALGNEFMHLLPEMLFFCLPLLALALKLVYFRSGRLYVEHLIFALHVQALAFLSFLVIDSAKLLGGVAGKRAESIAGAILVLGMLYLVFRAFRTVYGQGRLTTAVKLGLVLFVYGLILIFGIAALGAASAYLVARSA